MSSNTLSTRLLDGANAVEEAISLLQHGECVALPTETVYGLAADASNADAVNKIFAAKGRPKNHPLIVHIPDLSHLDTWAKNIPDIAYQLAEASWPGPLTLLLEKHEDVRSGVTGGLDTIGIRIPGHPLFLDVLKGFNGGLAAPSANLYKQLSPTMASHVLRGLSGRISAVLEGGQCEHGVESTIVDVLSDQPRILRAGPITRAQLEQILGHEVAMPASFNDVVPGNVEAHYQPRTPLQLSSSERLVSRLQDNTDSNIHLLVWSEPLAEACRKSDFPDQRWHPMPADAPGFASNLFATLNHIDQLDGDLIVVEVPPQTDDWRAVNDRLLRAATIPE